MVNYIKRLYNLVIRNCILYFEIAKAIREEISIVSTINMTEEQIEHWVEQQINILDRKYLNNKISTEEYEIQMREINKQAELMYYEKYTKK